MPNGDGRPVRRARGPKAGVACAAPIRAGGAESADIPLSDREHAEGFHLATITAVTTSTIAVAATALPRSVTLTKNLHRTAQQPQATHLPNRLARSYRRSLVPRATPSHGPHGVRARSTARATALVVTTQKRVNGSPIHFTPGRPELPTEMNDGTQDRETPSGSPVTTPNPCRSRPLQSHDGRVSSRDHTSTADRASRRRNPAFQAKYGVRRASDIGRSLITVGSKTGF